MNLIQIIDQAGLDGRGGAAFSTARKLAVAAENRAELIVNACDGEIDARKDAYVVAHHLPELIRGAELVASQIDAPRVRFAAHRGSGTLARLTTAGLDTLDVPARYVSSEETALVSLANGGLARPMTKRTLLMHGGKARDGRRFRPTLVLNAETVWRTAQIVEYGVEWFRRMGTVAEPGPRLVTASGAIGRPGVYDVAAGMPVRDVLAAAGGAAPDAEFVCVGGLAGGWGRLGDLAAATFDRRGLAEFGVRPGAGVLRVVSAAECPLDVFVGMMNYAAGESAEQCGPCMFGVPSLAGDVRELLVGAQTDDVLTRLEWRLPLMSGRGSCHFPDGVAGYVASAIAVLRDHIDDHARGRCAALASETCLGRSA